MPVELKIGLVEDDPVIRETIRGFLADCPWPLLFEAGSFEEATSYLQKNTPDLMLLDIRLGEEKSGILLGSFIRKQFPAISIIFITSLTDKETLTLASMVEPDGYIVKPFRADDLHVAIELAFRKKQNTAKSGEAVSDEIFVKNGHALEKLNISAIVFLQAEGNYVKIRTQAGKNLLIRSSLKDFAQQIPGDQFIQIHKSWIINLAAIKSVTAASVIAGTDTIPLSPAYRENLLARLKIL